MIEVRDLRFTWGRSDFELALPCLQVGPGQRLAVSGPSGAGKSTLLALLAGTLAVHEGSVVVAGHQLAGASEAERRRVRARHVGQVFQDFPLIDALDARDNVLLPYRVQPELALDGAARRRADALLERLGLGPLARRRPHALSQGERQRVAIARALVTAPALVLADEPTAGLDPARAQGVVDLLFDLTRGGTTLVLVAHDPAVLARFEARVDLSAPP